MLSGSQLTTVLKSVQAARYVTAVVTTVNPGRAVFLELEDEEFEVQSRILSRVLRVEDVLCVHILPIGRGRWLPTPGWLVNIWNATPQPDRGGKTAYELSRQELLLDD